MALNKITESFTRIFDDSLSKRKFKEAARKANIVCSVTMISIVLGACRLHLTNYT